MKKKTFTFEAIEVQSLSGLNAIFETPYASIVLMARYVNSFSFQPGIFFRVDRMPAVGDPLSFPAPEYYCAEMELMQEAKNDESFMSKYPGIAKKVVP